MSAKVYPKSRQSRAPQGVGGACCVNGIVSGYVNGNLIGVQEVDAVKNYVFIAALAAWSGTVPYIYWK